MRHGRRGADRDRHRSASARARRGGRAWRAVASAVARQVRRPPTRVREDRGLRLHGGLAANRARQLCGARRAAVPLTRPGLARRRGTPGAGDRGPVRRRLAATVDDRADRRRARCAERDPGHSAAGLHRERVRGVVRHPRRMGPDARRPVRGGRARVFSRRWFEMYADTLAAAAGSADLGGDALLHGDVRSDNLCFRDGRAMLVDWNWACRGASTLDVLSWLPSLNHEGGPEPVGTDARPRDARRAPRGVLPRARRPADDPQAPHVRRLQLDQGVVALPWACASWASPLRSDAA